MKRSNKKLSLNRETLKQLDGRQLDRIAGGRPELTEASCAVTACVRCPPAGLKKA